MIDVFVHVVGSFVETTALSTLRQIFPIMLGSKALALASEPLTLASQTNFFSVIFRDVELFAYRDSQNIYG